MNRGELLEAISDLKGKIEEMREDLEQIGSVLSPPSSLAIIIRIINLTKEMQDYEAMLDMIDFEEITKDF